MRWELILHKRSFCPRRTIPNEQKSQKLNGFHKFSAYHLAVAVAVAVAVVVAVAVAVALAVAGDVARAVATEKGVVPSA